MDKERQFPPGTYESASVKSNEFDSSETSSGSSIENLVSHNQDLASRLHVAVKKNIDLEKNISRFKKAHAHYEEKFQSARDQISIYREKDKHSKNESKLLKEKIQRLKAHLDYERKEFAEEKEKLEQEFSVLKPAFEEYKKLKKRVENEYLPDRDLLKEKLKEEEEKYERLEGEKKSILKKLGDASKHIQKMAQDFKASRERESSKHIAEVNSLEVKLEDIKNENIVLSDRNRVLRKEQIERTELLNRIEDLKKEKENFYAQAQEDKEDLLIQLNSYKSENGRLKMEVHDVKKQWAKTQSDFRNYKSATDSAEDELKSLRSLWQEKTSQGKNLEQVNENLSSKIEDLENKVAAVSDLHEETRQRLKFLFNQIENIKEKQNDRDKKATSSLEKAFKKALEPFLDFDLNL